MILAIAERTGLGSVIVIDLYGPAKHNTAEKPFASPFIRAVRPSSVPVTTIFIFIEVDNCVCVRGARSSECVLDKRISAGIDGTPP